MRAPFAAFRTFAAGAYRPTAPFMTPSAAYGLLLNVGAIEMRRDDGRSPITVTAEGLPGCEIALGAVCRGESRGHAECPPSVQTLYQQLHNYPVGAVAPERASATKGNKPNIQPIRREYLADLDSYVCLRGNDELEARVRDGLAAGAGYAPDGKRRYGMPFLGDNSFTLSVLREESEPAAAHWFVLATREQGPDVPNPCRLSVWIDRADSSRTTTRLFGREDVAQVEVPAGAWVEVGPR